ncbi:MAG: hypothetical protein ACE5IH_00580 [Thermodesulfobacteriota bacterium]
MFNKIVLKYADNTIKKGTAQNFLPKREFFHIVEMDESGKSSAPPLQVKLADLKAIFFVKTLEGKRGYDEDYSIERVGMGKRVQVTFKDGETIIGYTHGFNVNRTGFFLFPADPMSNNERIFVITNSTSSVDFV